MAEVNPAFVLQSVQNVSFEQRAVPQLRNEHDVRVLVEQTGICGSDVHYWQRGRIGDFILNSPIVLGHESAGTVVEVGKAVKNVKVGQKVAIEPGVPCRHCDYCRSGQYAFCDDTVFAATPPHDGTLQRYYTVAGDYVYPLPPHMDSEAGALIEPVSVAVQINKVSGMKAGDTVLVFGCGPIGSLSIAVAKASGAARVVGVDLSRARAEFARREMGADEIYVPERPSDAADAPKLEPSEAYRAMAEDIVRKFNLNGGEGADVVLECSGSEACINAGAFALRKGGTLCQAGMGKENVVFPITTVCIRGLKVVGSIRYSAGCYPRAIDLVASGKVDPKKLITHRFKFEEAVKAFEVVKAAQEDTLKVIIEGVQG